MKKLYHDELLVAGSIFLIGSVITSALNYLYHLFMGRMLGPEQYGILGSLFAIIYIVLFSSSAFTLVISKYTAQFHGKNQQKELAYVVYRGLRKTLIYGLVILFIYVLVSPLIAQFMHVSTGGVILVGIIAYASLVSSILGGALNGLQKFVWQNSLSVVSILLKFILAILLVYLGFGYMGALAAILIGIVVSIPFGIYPLQYLFIRAPKSRTHQKKIEFRQASPYFFLVFFAMLLPTLIITLDQILVKHYLASDVAGFYAASGMIAKVIFFGSGFFSGALFPKVVERFSRKKNTSSLLQRAFLYVLILVICGCTVYFIAPRFIATLLYGTQYQSIAVYIPLLGVSMGLFSLSHILVTYNLAMERYHFLWALILAMLFEIIGIVLFHASLQDIVWVILFTHTLLLLGLLGYTAKHLLAIPGNKLFKKD
jgi:O-antigen/teichoic acid export membrane protein